jgi:SAM-dependent methyltransferase
MPGLSDVVPKLSFRLMYLLGWTPWDTGITPPELVAAIEGGDRLEPGRALDLGCGTGTNAVYLASHGWDVVAVDFAPAAVAKARQKAAAAEVQVTFLVGDVTQLDALGVSGPFQLFFDLGCFHSIPVDRRPAYVDGAARRAAPGATFLLWAFGVARGRRPGISREEVEAAFAKEWETLDVKVDDSPARGTWYRLRRR